MLGGLIRNVVTQTCYQSDCHREHTGQDWSWHPVVPWYGSGWCYDGHQSQSWTWSPASVCDGGREGHPGYPCKHHTHHISSHWPSFVTPVEHSHDTYTVVTELWLATGITLQDIVLFPPPEDTSCHQNYLNNTLVNENYLHFLSIGCIDI